MVTRAAILALVLLSLVAGTATAASTYRRDTVGDAPFASVDIVSTSKTVWQEDGTKWFRISFRFAEFNGSVYTGKMRFDTRGGKHADSTITFSHWDNGPDPDGCTFHRDGVARGGDGGHARSQQRFKCTIPYAWLHANHRVRWIVLLGETGDVHDRAPDRGWLV